MYILHIVIYITQITQKTQLNADLSSNNDGEKDPKCNQMQYTLINKFIQTKSFITILTNFVLPTFI